MKKSVLTLLLALCAACSFAATAAEKSDTLVVSGNVLDAITRDYLDSVRVEMYEVPSMRLVSQTTIDDWVMKIEDPDERRDHERWNPIVRRRAYQLQTVPGTYLLRFNRQGYAEQEVDVVIPAKRYGRRTTTWDVKNVLLDRSRMRHLDEAVVSATKIKMLAKGDTLVFNADAFQMADGSMLDALIVMMPGLEIRNGSQIYLNGEYIPELLLNGKDFFKGSPAIALKNLPAYTVKSLNIYHRAPNDAYLRNDWTHDDTLSWNKVLDVRLKKQYNDGWIANAEVAGGPAFVKGDKAQPVWLSRLFGLHFTDHTRLGIFANSNNTNDTGLADSDGNWRNSWTVDPGVTTMQLGALDFTVDGKKTKVNYNTNLQAVREVTETERVTSATSFIPSGDVYNRSRSTSNYDRYHLVWKNTITWNARKASFSFHPSVEYFRRYRDSNSLSAQFSDAPDSPSPDSPSPDGPSPLPLPKGWGAVTSAIDSLYVPLLYAPLCILPFDTSIGEGEGALVNRVKSDASSVSDVWWQWAFLNTSFVDPILHGNVQIGLTEKYETDDTRQTQQYNLWRPAAETFQNRQTLTPTSQFSLSGTVYYRFPTWGKFNADFNYNYTKGYTRNRRELRLEEDAAPLPSVSDWQTVAIDLDNSFRAEDESDSHSLQSTLRFQAAERLSLSFTPILRFTNSHRSDTRAIQEEVRRKTAFFNPMASVYYRYRALHQEGEGPQGNLALSYSITNYAPLRSYLLDIRDTSNPLRITLGNADLRNGCSHHLSFTHYAYLSHRDIRTVLSYNSHKRQVAQGMSYNTATGVYTYRPENVDGNWSVNGSLAQSYYLMDTRFSLSSNTHAVYTNSVDLISPDGVSSAVRSVVRNTSVGERLSVGYYRGKCNAHAQVSADWNRATSQRAGFHTRSTFDCVYSLDFTANDFLWGLSFDTDLALRQRRGYDDATMNDNSLVWDAQLSRSFGREKAWNVRIKGHDLLRQLSNVQRTLNAQGLTETWVNSLPSYVMLHVSYRFNKSPKRE